MRFHREGGGHDSRSRAELERELNSSERDERVLRMIHLTINGLAAGLRNSG